MAWDARLIGLIGVDAAIAGVAPVVNSYWNPDIPLQGGSDSRGLDVLHDVADSAGPG